MSPLSWCVTVSLASIHSILSPFRTFNSVKTLSSNASVFTQAKRFATPDPSPTTGPRHGLFPMACLGLESAGLYPMLQVRSLLLTLSLLFSQDASEILCADFRNVIRKCQGCACVFKATLLGTPPASELQIHACPVPSRGNFHCYLFALAMVSGGLAFSWAPHILLTLPISGSGTLFPSLESHQFSPVLNFLVGGCWAPHRAEWPSPCLALFCCLQILLKEQLFSG